MIDGTVIPVNAAENMQLEEITQMAKEWLASVQPIQLPNFDTNNSATYIVRPASISHIKIENQSLELPMLP